MTPIFHPGAADDLADAAAWYDRQQPGLGDEFESAVLVASSIIAERPLAWSPWPGLAGLRVFNLTRFPYRLPYVIDDAVLILAVAHTTRAPDYWISRLRTK